MISGYNGTIVLIKRLMTNMSSSEKNRIQNSLTISNITLDSVLSKTKHVYDYLNYSTLVYSYESDTWELKETLNCISLF